jgi:hypothetical protein
VTYWDNTLIAIVRSFVTVALGSLITVVALRAAIKLFDIGCASILAGQGLSLEQIRARMATDPWVSLGGMAIGLAVVCIGGFVVGRIARGHELLHAAALGVATDVILLVLLVRFGHLTQPRIYAVLSYALTIPTALLGGFVARRISGKMWGPLNQSNA